jgi:CubicO group peptidase (beta-lactamase class C family)
MSERNITRTLITLALLFSFIFTSLPVVGYAQTAAPAVASDEYSKGLATIEEKVEARRKELGIPGMSLAIVKDDRVIYSKGLGYKDFENKVPVTADTQFAIGSSTKAFTALSVLMTADEGKLSLDASPKTVLPYFKMADPDTDKNMTIRDLMTHSSGLNRTDIAMITGKLTRAELIRVAGEAKPIAKLHEKFGYQNLMFAAAGEVVAVAQKKPWEEFVPDRIFKPLGMNNSTMSMKQMEKAKDRSFGYNYNFDTKETTKLPYRDIDQVAPAGSINSSANDMAKWVRFVLNGGVVDGKRLVSEKNYAEWLKPQMKVNASGTVSYGLGWFIQKWNGLTVVQHGGNIDGFNALVAMIPEKKVGFVMLTNVSASSLGGELMPIVWENILGKPEPPKAVAETAGPEKEAGIYRLEAAGVDIDVKWADGKLTASVPGQPTYTLANVSGRRYRLDGAPDGFFMTFKDTEVFLEQPHGNYTLPRVGAAVKPAGNPEAAKELIGKYESEANGRTVEVKEADGKVTLNIEGQQPYTLAEKSKDVYSLTPLPDNYYMKVARTPEGKIEKFSIVQPEGEFGFKPATEAKIAMTVDELAAKALAASGGADNWKKITSRVITMNMDLEQQGMKATATSWTKAPGMSATETKFMALGKEVATGWEFFDGTMGEEAYSFAPAEKFTGKRLDDVRIGSDFYSMLDWKSKYKNISIKRMAKVGDEEAYAVEFEPEKGTKFTDYYSTKTFLLLKREGTIPSSTSSVSLPYSVRYEDYRNVDGVMMPFKMTNNTVGNGDIVTVVTSVKHNTPIEDKFFVSRKVN